MNNNFTNLNYQRLSTAAFLVFIVIFALVFVLFWMRRKAGDIQLWNDWMNRPFAQKQDDIWRLHCLQYSLRCRLSILWWTLWCHLRKYSIITAKAVRWRCIFCRTSFHSKNIIRFCSAGRIIWWNFLIHCGRWRWLWLDKWQYPVRQDLPLQNSDFPDGTSCFSLLSF